MPCCTALTYLFTHSHADAVTYSVTVQWSSLLLLLSVCVESRDWVCYQGQQCRDRADMGGSRGPGLDALRTWRAADVTSPREITLFWASRGDIMTDGDEDVGAGARKRYLQPWHRVGQRHTTANRYTTPMDLNNKSHAEQTRTPRTCLVLRQRPRLVCTICGPGPSHGT